MILLYFCILSYVLYAINLTLDPTQIEVKHGHIVQVRLKIDVRGMEHNRSIKEPRSLGVSLTMRDYIVWLAHKKYKLLKTNAFILIRHICRILLNKSQHHFKIGQMMHN